VNCLKESSWLKINKLTEIATKIVSRFGDENLNKIRSLHFDDQVQATQDYSKKHIAENKRLFWERVRSDGVVALLPCEKDSRLCELHINHQVFDIFAASDSEALGAEYLNKAESDLLLIPVFDRFDSDEYNIHNQYLAVRAIRSLKAFNRSLNSKEKVSNLEDMARKTREELIQIWDKNNIDDDLIDQIFDFMVRDFSKYALQLYSITSSTFIQKRLCRMMIRKPVTDNKRYERVWEKYAFAMKDQYEMQA